MWTFAVILAAVSTVLVDCQTVNYSVLCPNHTMEIYQPVGPLCSLLITSVITDAEKVRIVDDHNALRRLVAQGFETRGSPGPQSPAADMKKLVWDEELAKVAQRWANQCNYGHDKCRKVDRFYVGQNAYRSLSSANSPTFNWTRAIGKWYAEVVSFNSANISPFQFSSAAGHYTAVLWANTEFIGCGYTFYKSTLEEEAKTPYIKYLVCNYGKGGNYVNEIMYLNGTACSRCPAGKVCDDFLCA